MALTNEQKASLQEKAKGLLKQDTDEQAKEMAAITSSYGGDRMEALAMLAGEVAALQKKVAHEHGLDAAIASYVTQKGATRVELSAGLDKKLNLTGANGLVMHGVTDHVSVGATGGIDAHGKPTGGSAVIRAYSSPLVNDPSSNYEAVAIGQITAGVDAKGKAQGNAMVGIVGLHKPSGIGLTSVVSGDSNGNVNQWNRLSGEIPVSNDKLHVAPYVDGGVQLRDKDGFGVKNGSAGGGVFASYDVDKSAEVYTNVHAGYSGIGQKDGGAEVGLTIGAVLGKTSGPAAKAQPAAPANDTYNLDKISEKKLAAASEKTVQQQPNAARHADENTTAAVTLTKEKESAINTLIKHGHFTEGMREASKLYAQLDQASQQVFADHMAKNLAKINPTFFPTMDSARDYLQTEFNAHIQQNSVAQEMG